VKCNWRAAVADRDEKGREDEKRGNLRGGHSGRRLRKWKKTDGEKLQLTL